MDRKKILVLTSTYPRWQDDHEPGFVHELSKRLSQHHNITVLCPHAKNALKDEILEGVTVRRYRYAPDRLETLVNNGGITNNLKQRPWKWLLVPGFLITQFWALWHTIRKEKPQVIHAHWVIPQGFIVALVSLIEKNTPAFVVTSHGADLFSLRTKPFELIKKFVFRRASGITVVSHNMVESLTHSGADPEKISVQPMGVDLAGKFCPDHSVNRSSDEILFVGRLVEKKGLKYLIRAMPAIVDKRPTAYLNIAGYGPEAQSLKDLVENLNLSDHVHFLGGVNQNELPNLYRKAGVFVAPFVQSRDGDIEGLGLVVAEAIGCHCPVVVGNVPAVQDLFPDNTHGSYVIDPHNIAGMKETILSIMEQGISNDELETLRKWVVKLIDWNVVADKYNQLLEKQFPD